MPVAIGQRTDPSPPAVAFALLRLTLVALIFISAYLALPNYSAALAAVTVAAGLYACGALAAAIRGRADLGLNWYGRIDLIFLGLFALLTGGAFSGLRLVFAVFPFMAAFAGRPRHTAQWAVASLTAYVVASVLSPVSVGGSLVTGTLFLSWAGALAVTCSIALTRRNDHIVELASSRRKLVAQALDAEAAERQRLAYALHDNPIQSLLAARQDLAASREGEDEAFERAQSMLEHTTSQLREVMFELHPHLLEQGGLAAVIRALAEQQGRRGGFEVEITVDEQAVGIHDQLLCSIARELLVNAAKHARAHRMTVDIAVEGESVQLLAADDGEGFHPARAEAALAEGHIGLMSIAERVKAVGGSFLVDGRRGLGARVRITIPRSTPPTRALAG